MLSICLVWPNSFGLKNHFYYHYCWRTGPMRLQPPITAAADLVFNLATESCLPHLSKKRRGKKSHFPELLPLTSDETQWQSLCFGFDSQCFLFPPLPHIFGKACSINQWHTCGQGSLEPLGHRGREEFPNCVLICMEIWPKKSLTAAGPFKANICIVFIYVVLQQRGLSGPLGFLLCLVKDWQMQKNDVKALTL